MKRVIALGMLAASLIVAPTAAFAGDSQNQTNDQYTEQNGAASEGSVNVQKSESDNVQRQEIKNRRGRRGYDRYGRRYRRYDDDRRYDRHDRKYDDDRYDDDYYDD